MPCWSPCNGMEINIEIELNFNLISIIFIRYKDYLRGRSVRKSLKTRKIPNIRGLLSAEREMRMSTREIPTRKPSITFQPLFRYACCPITRPLANTCIKQALQITEIEDLLGLSFYKFLRQRSYFRSCPDLDHHFHREHKGEDVVGVIQELSLLK